MYVDHINGSGLDNRRCNLREVTPRENANNKKSPAIPTKSMAEFQCADTRTGFIGVSRHQSGKFRAYINTGGFANAKQHFLGHYESPEQAAVIRDMAAKYFWGNKAILNFPDMNSEAKSPSELRILFRKRSHATSKYVGVSKRGKKWRAAVKDPLEERIVNLGTFRSETDAAIAYDRVARHFELEDLNFPEENISGCPPDELPDPEPRSRLGFWGVYKKRNKFVSRLTFNRKHYKMGAYDTAEDAAEAYDSGCRFLGHLTRLNFPEKYIPAVDPRVLALHVGRVYVDGKLVRSARQ